MCSVRVKGYFPAYKAKKLWLQPKREIRASYTQSVEMLSNNFPCKISRKNYTLIKGEGLNKNFIEYFPGYSISGLLFRSYYCERKYQSQRKLWIENFRKSDRNTRAICKWKVEFVSEDLTVSSINRNTLIRGTIS